MTATGWAGLVGLALLGGTAVLGPLADPANPLAVHLGAALLPPGPAHPLGTDALGRDELARLLWGARPTLGAGALAAVVAMGLGTAVGALAGWSGGLVDTVLMRATDVALAVPGLVLVLAVSALIRLDAAGLAVVVGALAWMPAARLVRSGTRALVDAPWVAAARDLGVAAPVVWFRHVLPHLAPTLAAAAPLAFADAVAAVAALSFLGLGLPPPTPNWGAMLAEAQPALTQGAWWLLWPPGLAVTAAVTCALWLADALGGT
ncbi:MAG: ABC transporter permease [Actinomycetia bacterium]|nr:ABC transporter permease [Actinomycetes bacterium]